MDYLFAAFVILPVLVFFSAAVTATSFKTSRRRPYRIALLIVTNVLVFVALCATGNLIGEVYYRWFYDSTDALALTNASRAWFDRHYHLNNVDVRDSRDYRAAADPVRRRITFIGDSFTAGHGVENVEVRFANRIRRSHPDWEVDVFGVNGMDTVDQVNFLRGEVFNDYEFDVVVLVYCLNDISKIMPEWQEILGRLYSRRPGFIVSQSFFLNALYYRWLYTREPELGNYYDFVREGYRDDAVWGRQEMLLAAFVRYVKSRNAIPAVVTFPFFHGLGTDYEYRVIHQQLSAFWQRECVAHLDLLEDFIPYESDVLTVGATDPHPNEKAHAIAAESISRFIERIMAARE